MALMNTLPAEVLDQYRTAVEAANKAAEDFKAITSGAEERIVSFLNTSEDEQVVKFREYRDKVTAQIEAAQKKLDDAEDNARKYAESQVATDDGDPAAIKEQAMKSRREANEIAKALSVLVGEEAFTEAAKEAGIPDLAGIRGAGNKGATGIRRPRLERATVNGHPVADKDGKTSFGLIESYIGKAYGKVDGNDLRSAAFQAAGTDDLSTVKGEEISFTFTVPGIGDGPTRDVNIVVVSR